MEVRVEQRRTVKGIPYRFDCHEQEMEGPGLMTNAHLHNYIELLYCTAGRCDIQLDDGLHQFGVGDLVLINSQEVHRVTATDPVRTHYLVMKFEPEVLFSAEQSVFEIRYLLPFTLRETPHQKVIPAQELQNTEIPDLIRDAVSEFQKRGYGFELAVRADVCRVFLWILRRWHKDVPEDAWGAGLDDGTMRLLRQAMDYVEENYAQDVLMSDIAKRLGMGYSSFSKFFLKYTRRNFAEYLNSVRIRRAEILLTTTDMNVTEIAMATGFSTASYFIERFREMNGVTPKKFRTRFGL